MPDSEEPRASGADEAYEWTIRVLYAVLIVGNLLLAWEAWKDTTAGIEWRARTRARFGQLSNCSGCARRREWLKARAHMLWQATEIVEDHARTTGGGPGAGT